MQWKTPSCPEQLSHSPPPEMTDSTSFQLSSWIFHARASAHTPWYLFRGRTSLEALIIFLFIHLSVLCSSWPLAPSPNRTHMKVYFISPGTPSRLHLFNFSFDLFA